MTLYHEKLKSLVTTPRTQENSMFDPHFLNWQQEVTVTLIITNMKSPEDCTKLTEGLRTLPGVIKVTPLLSQHRLAVTYDTSKTQLELIGYQIRKLGYHYIQKA